MRRRVPIILAAGVVLYIVMLLVTQALTGPQINADVNNVTGILAPGSSVGLLTISGDYTQDPSASINFEIGGVVPQQEHDVLAITGDATLGGTFHFVFVDEFQPKPASVFTLLTAGQVIGEFDTVLGPGVFDVMYDPENVTLFVVQPELPGNCDKDGDVDLFDFASFQECLTGPGGGPIGAECACADLDDDDDADLIDFGAFQRAFE